MPHPVVVGFALNDISCARRDGAAPHFRLQIPFQRALEPVFRCMENRRDEIGREANNEWLIKNSRAGQAGDKTGIPAHEAEKIKQ
ncbi:MAG: hypothetical protein K0M66_05175 [Thiobacillus sp.]|nr:hypothetical protein [Thiobacillus sp.]